MRRDTMSRVDAAAFLGLPVDAGPGEVHRAFRVWARVAHPDAGGDPQHFTRLTQARRTMLQPLARHTSSTTTDSPAPRAPLSSMVRVPTTWLLLAIGAAGLVSLAFLPRIGVSVPLAAFIAGIAAAAWSTLATHAAPDSGADAGHRIAMHALTWLPLAAILILVSIVFGTDLVTVLPLLALPFAAVIAWQNAGAGLWRPIGGRS